MVSISNGLKISSNDEKFDAWPAFALASLGDGGIDGVKSAMAATFHNKPAARFVVRIQAHPSLWPLSIKMSFASL
jgi:hypothetical protein